MHNLRSPFRANGRANVERGTGLAARFVAWASGFPRAMADTPVEVYFDIDGDQEIWRRSFGGDTFSSRQFAGKGRWQGLICERFGALVFAMALVRTEAGLSLVVRGWRLLGVRAPLWLCPTSRAGETVQDGRFHFEVEIGHPLTGMIVRYRGWLAP